LSFTDFSLSPELTRSIKDRGHHQATPIQADAIPVAMAGRDLIATAETGSGKTAAYLIPLIHKLQGKQTRVQRRPTTLHAASPEHAPENVNGHRHDGPAHPSGVRAVVLVPTRELAAQVAKEFGILARHTRLRAALIVGGDSMRRQLQDLQGGASVLVACPGRLNDHLERGTVKLANIEIVVVDEADRMLDMGFLPQLRRIMKMVPAERQTLMFSATMGSGVAQVAREFLRDPEHVSVGEKATPPSQIHQTIYPVTNDNKGPMLIEILKSDDVESAIVFTRTRSRADRVARMLVRSGIKAVAIHGDRSQSQRNAALAGFRSRTYRVMVATDVAARGLDIPDVSHVINYDLPDESENYIHRIGRTARMGKAGEALSLVTPEERATLGRLERTLGKQLDRETVEGFEAPQITAPKPVTLFRSSHNSRRNRPRARWA
jgi:ATP-dependent RNA helicase RhlE